MRKRHVRNLGGSLALALTVVHVAFVSMHLALMASMALAGQAGAAQGRLGFVFCATTRATDPAGQLAGATSDEDSQPETATFCPVCAGAAGAAALPPALLTVPAYTVLDTSSNVVLAPAVTVVFEAWPPALSRAPPILA
ncbi:MAG: DUF2946 family protein [Hyphomicrobiaceae bacterium]